MNPKNEPKKKFYQTKFYKLVLFFFMMFALAEVTGIRDQLSVEYIRGLFLDNFWTSVSVYTLLFVIGNFLHVPGGVFLIGIILALGKVEGGVITYFVAIFSCMVSYYTISFFAKGSLDKVDNKIINKFIHQIDDHPIRTIFILRFIMQSAPVLNYTLASTNISARAYLIGTILGLPLPIVAYAYFSDYFIQVVIP